MPKQFNDYELAEAYIKYRKCVTVAEEYGCSAETVRRALIKHDVQRVKRNPRPVTKKRATVEELQQIVAEYYVDGMTINDLAVKYKRSQKTISNAINEYGHGLKRDPTNRKITVEELREAAETLNLREIAVAYGMSEEQVYRRARNNGIKVFTKGTGGHWRRRASRYGVSEYDETITLKKCIEKNNGVCQICGKPVDENDIVNGHIKKLYPTVDHIVPLSKGGTHTWENVQLAHMDCNAGKCDK